MSGQGVSRNQMDMLMDLAAQRDMPLHPDLVPYMSGPEDGLAFPMLRHPLVYAMLPINGMCNDTYEKKQRALAEAVAEENWDTAVFLHERPYRLKALIDYVTGRNEDGDIIALDSSTAQDTLDLVADVWVDSENIEQVVDEWRALIGGPVDGLWLGTPAEREKFDALETYDHKVFGPCVKAWRGGAVGDWSWTTDYKIAEFFSRRSGLHVRGTMIPVSDVFGYLTRRGEAELLVRFTDFRASMVYPEQYPRTTGW